MKVATAEQPWYLVERAEGLAVIYLTEDARVEVNRSRDVLPGLDIVATLRENGRLGGRLFGVEVKAARTHEAGRDNPRPKTWAVPSGRIPFFRDIPFPVCLFHFTVDDDQGQWGWIQQPVVSPDTGAHLVFHDRVPLSPLTTQEVTRIVSEVDRWYNERKKPAAIFP